MPILVEIEVTRRRSVGMLSGNWVLDVGVSNQGDGIRIFRTQFTEVYRVSSLTLKSVASLQMETNAGVKAMSFSDLRFDGDVSLAGIDLTSTLSFRPDATVADRFDYWLTSTRFCLLDVDVVHTFYLAGTQTDSYQSISTSAQFGDVGISNNLRLKLDGRCGSFFSSIDTAVIWQWCGVALLASISFSQDGLEVFTVGISDLPLPGFGFASSLGSLDYSISFDMEGKSLATGIDWRPGALSCFELLTELDLGGPGVGPISGNTALSAIHIYGLKLVCAIPSAYGDIAFVSATSLDASYNSIVTGQTDYFEVIRLSGPLLTCCGYPGSWGMAAYFNVGSTSLFDWGMTLLYADIVFSDHFSFSLETVFRSGFFGDPTLELSIGWMTRW
jgi:hypothetical protein